ncbi:MAG TPA: alpha-xylosidase, partial [Clostridiales bacterium]|nr:alpha-xylosidase [Clostridiales bacterium]
HKEQDFYVFAYGTDYKQAVKDFLAISGQTPMLPRYVLGNWWSRYYVYNEKSYLSLLDKFAENSIPLTVATIDMDW